MTHRMAWAAATLLALALAACRFAENPQVYRKMGQVGEAVAKGAEGKAAGALPATEEHGSGAEAIHLVIEGAAKLLPESNAQSSADPAPRGQ